PKTTGGARITDLTLTGGDFAACPKIKKRKTYGVAAAGPRIVRQLFGSGRGRFRTSGGLASATIRGTIWRIEDRCDGTWIGVTRGTVAVDDFKRRRTVVVTAGHTYI